MVDSQVPCVQLTPGGEIVLNVQVAGFTDGNPVEIYGYVTQESGVYAAFRAAGQLPGPDSEGVANVLVTLSPKELELDETQPVTVVTWVSEVWPSMLTVATSTSNGFKAQWEIDNAAADSWRYKSRAMSAKLRDFRTYAA